MHLATSIMVSIRLRFNSHFDNSVHETAQGCFHYLTVV